MFNIITIVSACLLLHSANSQVLDLKKCGSLPPLDTFDLTQVRVKTIKNRSLFNINNVLQLLASSSEDGMKLKDILHTVNSQVRVYQLLSD